MASRARDAAGAVGAAATAAAADRASFALASRDATRADRLRLAYEAYLPEIYRYVYAHVGNREQAEDLTSQVFLTALRGLDTARADASIESWLFHVARTTLADHWRHCYHLPQQSLDLLLDAGWEAASPGGWPPSAGNPRERVRRILSQLPARYAQVLVCRFLRDLSIKETAEVMGLSEVNVKVVQFRALRRAARLELPAAPAPAVEEPTLARSLTGEQP